jgi:hypothetical protein
MKNNITTVKRAAKLLEDAIRLVISLKVLIPVTLTTHSV